MMDSENSIVEKEISAKRDEERKRQSIEVSIENDWWREFLIKDEQLALSGGRLVKVPIDSFNYRLVSLLRRDEEPRSLAPIGLQLLFELTARWKFKLLERSSDIPEIRLSVSSLFRTVEWQEDRIKRRLNAADISPHQSGMAIDFDPNGYYLGEERKAVQRGFSDFDPRYIETFREVLEDMTEFQRCHVIWEKNYRANGQTAEEYDNCWHVCVNPNFNG